MTTSTAPHEFGRIDCRDGISITKPADLYHVTRDGRWVGSCATLEAAMRLVETTRASVTY